MESAAPQTPVQALEALQNAYSRFLDALPEARRASLGERHRSSSARTAIPSWAVWWTPSLKSCPSMWRH